MANGVNEHGAPTLGDNIIVGSGTAVLGNISAGNNIIIGANAMVVKNVPDNSIAIGNPAIVKNRFVSGE